MSELLSTRRFAAVTLKNFSDPLNQVVIEFFASVSNRRSGGKAAHPCSDVLRAPQET